MAPTAGLYGPQTTLFRDIQLPPQLRLVAPCHLVSAAVVWPRDNLRATCHVTATTIKSIRVAHKSPSCCRNGLVLTPSGGASMPAAGSVQMARSTKPAQCGVSCQPSVGISPGVGGLPKSALSSLLRKVGSARAGRDFVVGVRHLPVGERHPAHCLPDVCSRF